MIGTYGVENSGLNEETTRQARRAAAANDELRALAFADLDVLLDCFELLRTDQRAHLNVGFQTITEFPFRNAFDHLGDDLVRNGFLKNSAARRGTALAARSKSSRDDTIHGEIQIRILQDNHRILATHFTLRLHATRSAGGIDPGSVFGGAGE